MCDKKKINWKKGNVWATISDKNSLHRFPEHFLQGRSSVVSRPEAKEVMFKILGLCKEQSSQFKALFDCLPIGLPN